MRWHNRERAYQVVYAADESGKGGAGKAHRNAREHLLCAGQRCSFARISSFAQSRIRKMKGLYEDPD